MLVDSIDCPELMLGNILLVLEGCWKMVPVITTTHIRNVCHFRENNTVKPLI